MKLSTLCAAAQLAIATVLLAACGKSADPAPVVAAAPAGIVPISESGRAAATGDYMGLAIYPGMSQLTVTDLPAGPGVTMHSGNFRSSDPKDKILAFYRENLSKKAGPGGTIAEDILGQGMTRLAVSLGKDKAAYVMIHADDSGTIVGIQILSKD